MRCIMGHPDTGYCEFCAGNGVRGAGTATYYLVFGTHKGGTRFAGGHDTHGAFTDRSDAIQHARSLESLDPDRDYQVCAFQGSSSSRDKMIDELTTDGAIAGDGGIWACVDAGDLAGALHGVECASVDVGYAIAQIQRLLASSSVRTQDTARRALDALERVEERLK